MNEWAAYITRDARAMGVRRGDVLLVHASLKSLGAQGLTPADVVRGLAEAVGPEGTLVFPTLSYATCGAAHPVYNVRTTPACTGAIPEYARSAPGAVRSLCPTHSCAAIGPLAQQLTAQQHLDGTPCGPHSAFALLPQLGGSVLFLGCGCRCNTSMHAAEEEVVPPYLFGADVTYTVTDAAGNTRQISCRAHNFSGVRQRYERTAFCMERGVTSGAILAAPCILLQAQPMWDTARRLLRQDPCALVSAVERDA